MMRRISSLFLLAAALGALAIPADLPSAWRSWRYARPIDSPRSDTLNYVILDRDVFAHSEDHLADLRMIDDLGHEIPYEVRSQITPPPQPVELASTFRENSFVPGQFTQVVLDLGDRAAFHNSVRIQTTESDFINWVEVAASDDAHQWRIVNPRAPISRFRKENLEGNQLVRYSENNARYLRVRIQEAGHSFPVTGMAVFSSPPLLAAASNEKGGLLTGSLAPDANAEPSQTQWTIDLQGAAIPIASFNFETTQPEFYRAVRLLNSSDEKEWQSVGGGEIHRFLVNGRTEESLAVQSYETWGSRYWRLQVLNASDAPLSEVRLSLTLPSRFLIFHASSGRSYRLIYGNFRANAPQYDLARTLRIEANQTMTHLPLGIEEATSNYADPRPFTERHPNLLWIALAIAVILLAGAAVRAMRTPAPSGPQE